MYIVYTDGSARNNPGPGGLAFVMVDTNGQIRYYCRGFELTTNNRMEMGAFIYAMFTLHRYNYIKRGDTVKFCVDSNYLKDSFEQWIDGWAQRGWKNVKNLDLVQIIYLYKKNFNIIFEKVPAHQDNEMNNTADKLANKMSGPDTQKIRDIRYERNTTEAALPWRINLSKLNKSR